MIINHHHAYTTANNNNSTNITGSATNQYSNKENEQQQPIYGNNGHSMTSNMDSSHNKPIFLTPGRNVSITLTKPLQQQQQPLQPLQPQQQQSQQQQQPVGLRTPLASAHKVTFSSSTNMMTPLSTNRHLSGAPNSVTKGGSSTLTLSSTKTTAPPMSSATTSSSGSLGGSTSLDSQTSSSSSSLSTTKSVRRRSKKSSLNYVLINLQSLFKSKHQTESKLLAEGLRQDYRSPIAWYRALNFLFHRYATPTDDYDDSHLNEGRYNLQQIYHLTMPHINQKHRQSANELDEGSRAAVDEKVMMLTMQQMYLLYLLSADSVQAELRVKMEDLKVQLKALFYTRTVDTCSLFYILYSMTMSDTQKCLTYLAFAREKQAKPEHIISDAELYIRTHQTMHGFNPMVYFEPPEPIFSPATPMSSARSNVSSPASAGNDTESTMDNVEEPVLLAPTSVSKRKRESSSDLLSNPSKMSRTSSLSSVAKAAVPSNVAQQHQPQQLPSLSTMPSSTLPSTSVDMFPQPTSQPQASSHARGHSGNFVAPRPVQPQQPQQQQQQQPIIVDHHQPIALPQQQQQQQMPPQLQQQVQSSDSSNVFYVNGKPYRVIDWLGKGGSSKVYRVLSPDSKIVALKIVSLKGHDKQTLEGFVNEVQLLHKLRGKPNIIELKDFELQKECLMIVMECGDSDLSTVLRMQRGRVLPPNQIRLYCQQMLEALNTIHEQRIVHSDLKPANFLFVKGQLKLIDFGIAKQIRSDTTNIMRDSQVGTVNYIPPEAFVNHSQPTSSSRGNPRYKLGRSSDLWSFGCIVYQMVYGAPPFASLDLIPKIHAITNVNHKIQYPPLPSGMDSNILYVLQSTLVRNPEQRATIPQLLESDFLVPNKPGNISIPRDYLSSVVSGLLRHMKPEVAQDEETLRKVSRNLSDLIDRRTSSNSIVKYVLSELESDKAQQQ